MGTFKVNGNIEANNISAGGTISATSFIGDLDGNAATATKLKTARNFTIGSTAKSFNGTAAVSWTHAEIGATVSNAWMAGTTSGPTLTTTVNGVDSAAVAIPSANTSMSGVVTTGSQEFAGQKIFRYPKIKPTSTSASGVGLFFLNNKNTTVADLWYNPGDPNNVTTGYFRFEQYSPNSTVNNTTTGYAEIYSLPTVSSGLTTNKSYEIFTSKSYTTLDSRYVNVSGDTITGNINMGTSSTTNGPAIKFPSNKRNYIWMGYANDNGSWYIWDGHNSKGIIASDINGNNTFYGNAATATRWALKGGSTVYTGDSDWDGALTDATYYTVYNQEWGSTAIGPDTGDLRVAVRPAQYTSGGTEVCLAIDGDYYSMGNKVLHTGNYYNYADGRYVNVSGDTMTGQLKLAIIGGGWYNPVVSPTTAGLSYDASSSTSSTYWPIVNLKFPNSTFSLGGERATDVFGIFRYANTRTENGYDAGFWCNGGNNYFYCSTRLYGAVWNDYAEFRNQDEEIKPGYCVTSSKSGKVYKTTERLQYCEGIVSDTYGFSIGETDNCKTPLAVSGRVLAYYDGDISDYEIGDAVCATVNGLITKMTREEIKKYPDRIVGTVSEIPSYDTWGSGNVPTAGRIWIKV